MNITKFLKPNQNLFTRSVSSHFQFVVAGGGAGGCATASKLCGLGKTAVIDPSNDHYYQPLWTLVGAGIKTDLQSQKKQKDCIPSKATWIKQEVEGFEPTNNVVYLGNGHKVTYDYLVVALGLDIRFDKIKGLPETLGSNGVCSNYGPGNARYTWQMLQETKSGSLLFTYPNAPIKCAGAPQKIMYLAEAYLRKQGVRDQCTVDYHTALPAIFGVKKYADALTMLAEKKGCGVHVKSNLVEVCGKSKQAVFEDLDSKELTTRKFDFLHVGPPCAPSPVYATSPLADEAGWVDVDKLTLQHNTYSNVFAIGDCNSCPTGKTAAKVAAESGILYANMKSVLEGKPLKSEYNGYTSCPLTVGDGKLVLAEFGYDGSILETLPINQAKPSRFAYHLKKDLMPFIYWSWLLRGNWDGPKRVRKLLHLGTK